MRAKIYAYEFNAIVNLNFDYYNDIKYVFA